MNNTLCVFVHPIDSQHNTITPTSYRTTNLSPIGLPVFGGLPWFSRLLDVGESARKRVVERAEERRERRDDVAHRRPVHEPSQPEPVTAAVVAVMLGVNVIVMRMMVNIKV